MADDLKVTQQSYLNQLKTLMDTAFDAKNCAVAVRAWELVGKVEGRYVERIRDETPRSPAELEEALREVRAKLAGDGLPHLVSGPDSGESEAV